MSTVSASAPRACAVTAFLDDAERFADAAVSTAPFRFLRAFTRCTEEELRRLACKVYTESLPEGGACAESPAKAWLKSLAHPLHYLWSRRVFWRRAPEVLFDLETIDKPYFERWFSDAYARMPGPKRLTPRVDSFDHPDAVSHMFGSITPRSALWLFLGPFFIPRLWAMSPPANRPKFLAAFRQALGVYAAHDGHFARYPCRHFVTFSDETNHPSRHIAFRQRCGGRLVVIQNGERTLHPLHAFGSLDEYLVFGAFVEELGASLRMKAVRYHPVGALCLNEFHPLLRELERGGGGPDYDILLIDQSLWPHNGMDQAIGESLFKIWANVDRLMGDRPGLRVAFQLRPYDDRDWERQLTLRAVRERFTRPITVLENRARGDSYRGVFRSRLVVTCHSTIGYEAFFFGRDKKTLFVNYSGGPFVIDLRDERFNLDDPSADYETFKRRIDELLALELKDVPAAMRARHAFFDGRVQERIAAYLTQEVARA